MTTPHATEELSIRGFTKPHKLETWESNSFVKDDVQLNIMAMPGIHGSLPVAVFLPQVMGSILDFQTKDGQHLLRLYITGDTLVFDDIKQILKHYPNIDVALLHLGGTMEMGIMLTMDAKEDVETFRIIHPKKIFLFITMIMMSLSHRLRIFSGSLKKQGLKNGFTI